MSREVEMLAMVIADLRLQVETLKESVNRRDALIDETNAKTEDSIKVLNNENDRLQTAIQRAMFELEKRTQENGNIDGLYNLFVRWFSL